MFRTRSASYCLAARLRLRDNKDNMAAVSIILLPSNALLAKLPLLTSAKQDLPNSNNLRRQPRIYFRAYQTVGRTLSKDDASSRPVTPCSRVSRNRRTVAVSSLTRSPRSSGIFTIYQTDSLRRSRSKRTSSYAARFAATAFLGASP